MSSTSVPKAAVRWAVAGALAAPTASAARSSRSADADAARVLLHCAGAKAAENPFYAALAVRLAGGSRWAGRALVLGRRNPSNGAVPPHLACRIPDRLL
ncbi:hypothetical protein I4F81_001649 [Pyropia yezoensis]|uniref:Uncharacterized protein n=1 Tax=Pyropia yezoensis TaxID=2788 RepID=A0ACC3BM73_PYRYE|nr:hypothetical protein I4F81_001649 [Neopyropia yezoensis]